jgi:23S rRNA (uracil1939-C5)-methyltransferase
MTPPPIAGGGWGEGSATALPDPGTARVEPPCQHFGTCGGCVLQHWRDDAYIAWKTDLLRTALRRGGYADAVIAAAVRTGPGERRRMDLAARRVGGRIVLGVHRLRSAEVVDLAECHVLHPLLAALIAPLRALLSRLRAFRREGSVIANLLDSGPDMLLRTDAALHLDDRIALTEFARALALPRIAWAKNSDEPEPVAILRPPSTMLSGVNITPPPGAFLQASPSGEAAIITAVVDAIPANGRIAELFAGCGAITFALARRTRVNAWEGDPASVSALRAAANHAGLSSRVTVTQRDLARQPLQAKELAGFASLVLDPPFAGAAAQVTQIATSHVPSVIYVSCNPATLARDARMLSQAGYRLTAATPIDQFLWSARLESVCVFNR